MGIRTLFVIALVYVLWRVYQDSFGKKSRQNRTESPTTPLPNNGIEDAYQTLGVSSDATFEEIRVAYQKLIQQYHPDRVNDMGEELRTLAETRTKEINQAYNEIKKNYH